MPRITPTNEPHSTAWVAQVWMTWLIAMFAVLGGIVFVPADLWVKGYLFMGLLFTVGSTMNLAKTVRDNHEASKVSSVIHDARIEKILSEHDPLK
ncbi:MAG: YiaA/YiaB family inner membrane protein [Myxococcota bacterium]